MRVQQVERPEAVDRLLGIDGVHRDVDRVLLAFGDHHERRRAAEADADVLVGLAVDRQRRRHLDVGVLERHQLLLPVGVLEVEEQCPHRVEVVERHAGRNGLHGGLADRRAGWTGPPAAAEGPPRPRPPRRPPPWLRRSSAPPGARRRSAACRRPCRTARPAAVLLDAAETAAASRARQRPGPDAAGRRILGRHSDMQRRGNGTVAAGASGRAAILTLQDVGVCITSSTTQARDESDGAFSAVSAATVRRSGRLRSG